ncbi:MAG: carbonate dehydratase [Gallionellales bacterium 35-53-114]|jgi:magnesium-transporting ATPase (P-type)|nr:MAG: carbonate dehydratase [Gallionellales bacterium 35-53-114]OYZ63239.1 MAG: carbonate dehydratase [Gallionellales bacterium 24-53-125]OZB08704.1 MAG: carbonate dehydratase [Gallionellales bacterium 39-52-133]HQS57434.1 cation-transporting P-type ATPase [Gallionellaceae bacterium]HQS74378.1 cation-transporting P-type ATPase [Gallionellaceae bacterium]
MIHHAETSEAVLVALESDKAGLSSQAAAERLKQHGPNLLPPPQRRGALLRFALQFHNPLIYVLLASAAVTLWLEHFVDAGVIIGVVVINAIIGFIQEGKAERALEAVRAMLASHAMVLRDGERHEIDAAELVPGDIVLLESGTRVPADLRLLRVINLRINESALTGESLPVEKNTEPVAAAAGIGDRLNMAYSGTVVNYGQARGVVVATGATTEIGRIGTLVSGVDSLATPLTRRLDQFSRQITLFILLLGLITFLYGYYVGGMAAIDIFLAVVGLAVAAIPEGLPAIVTITLAIGTGIMARRKAIVRRLPAVETLGSVSVICSDKTGTLTRNEITAVRLMLGARTLAVSGAGYAPEGGFHLGEQQLEPREDAALQRLARCALLCNDARLHHDEAGGWTLAGDPTEGGLLTMALKAGLDSATEIANAPRIDEIPFESEHRFMSTLHHDHEGQAFVFLKGAPERVLALSVNDSDGQPLQHEAWLARMAEAAALGQRVLALATCRMPPGTATLSMADMTPRFTLLGLVGMIDPPRSEAIAAIAECRRAGIRVVMITGDHAITASAIARELGLNERHPLSGEMIDGLDDAALQQRISETDVVARASPEHKLRLVGALQAQGKLVAMTGDGVNDAPALKAADIGVAMGQRGTDAAREASDLVLTDDNFATIAQAVREGRTVFDNIKKSLLFILPTNGGEAGVILLAVFAGLAMPVTAGQILWVNMVTTVTLALALAFEPAEAGVMSRPPRPPAEPLITPLLLGRIIYVSLLMIAVSFAVFEWELARGSSIETARTAVVNMLVFGEMVYLFNARHFTAHALARDTLYGNPVAFWASVLLIVMQLLLTYAPTMQKIFNTTALDAASWTLILGLALAKFFAVEAEKWLLRRFGVQRM